MTLDRAFASASPQPPVKRKRPPHRVWPVQEKRRIVEEALAPGASVAAVGRRHSVNTNMIFRWRREYREGAYGPASPEPTGQNFIPVGVIGEDGRIVRSSVLDTHARLGPPDAPLQIESAAVKPNPPPSAEKPVQRVDLELPNKTRLTFDATMDETVFRRLIAMVKDVT